MYADKSLRQFIMVIFSDHEFRKKVDDNFIHLSSSLD